MLYFKEVTITVLLILFKYFNDNILLFWIQYIDYDFIKKKNEINSILA